MDAGLALRPRRDILEAAKAGRATIVHQRDGFSGRVSVLADGPDSLVFSIDGAPNASTSPEDMLTQMALAHLPAVAADAPRRALVIGLGTGITAGSLSLFPGVAEVQVAEIEPVQAGVAAVFRGFNHGVLERSNVRVRFDDARHLLLTERGTFDVISSDPADLFVGGMVNLYTLEFYRLVRARLAPGGAFVQWIHAYHLDSDDLRGAVRTALEVFPHAGLWVEPHGDLFLLATGRPLRLDLEAWDRRLRDPAVAADLARAGIIPASDLAGFFLWGSADLARYAQGGRLCTDADPFLEFTAPRRPFSRREQNRLGREVACFEPLDPAPLVRETVASRARLARLALGHGFVARARAECRRALELAPGRPDLVKQLAGIEAAARAFDGN
jgi:spermidine synthase